MSADFDNAAITYDQDFTYSGIGILQRERVWKNLSKHLEHKGKMKILELNCGTGEDAGKLAIDGNNVVATDISEEMLLVARKKNQHLDIKFQQLDLNNIDQSNLDSDFDLVFSNFGGLNCIDPAAIAKVGEKLSQILKPGGKFIAVIMPKACLWENIYLILKGKWDQVFRRSEEVVEVNVSGKIVNTWYYDPQNFSKLIGHQYIKEDLKPIGFFIPPSYMESFFKRKRMLLKCLNALEKMFSNFSFQARFSDHYYIAFKKT
ncbi:class I SAM-dependent methyltransferase [Ekhidna sp.]